MLDYRCVPMLAHPVLRSGNDAARQICMGDGNDLDVGYGKLKVSKFVKTASCTLNFS